jgi:hypothetical protein
MRSLSFKKSPVDTHRGRVNLGSESPLKAEPQESKVVMLVVMKVEVRFTARIDHLKFELPIA